MIEFKSCRNSFYKNTHRRIFYELLSFLLLSIFFWSEWSKNIPNWVEYFILAILIIYILPGILLYPKIRTHAENFSIYLLDDTLGFNDKGDIRQIPYTDFVDLSMKRRSGEVIEIKMKTVFDQTIKLESMENMNELYDQLVERIKIIGAPK